ncbi:MAG: signal peptidase I [bacterium]|nr:signal peptidase I [bacterium]
MTLIKFLLNSASYVFYVLILLIIFFTVTSHISVVGGLKSLLIRSGSMEPTILTGDIIMIRPALQYGQHDIVTFYDEDDRIVTHRITKVDQSSNTTRYRTKGDANRSIDQDTIINEQILGKVVFIVPKMGFLASFARTPVGILGMIIVPALIILIDRMIAFNLKK